VPTICIILLLLRMTARPLHIPPPSPRWPIILGDQLLERGLVESRMNRSEGNQLLLVRYRPEHDPGKEWVYNVADVHHGKIVWARDMGREKNQELLNYFRGRQIWLVEPDEAPVKVSSYCYWPLRPETNLRESASVGQRSEDAAQKSTTRVVDTGRDALSVH